MKKKNMLSKIIQNAKKIRLELIEERTEETEKSALDIAKEKAAEFYKKQIILVSRIQDESIAEIYKGIIDHYRKMIDKDLPEAISVTSEEYFAKETEYDPDLYRIIMIGIGDADWWKFEDTDTGIKYTTFRNITVSTHIA